MTDGLSTWPPFSAVARSDGETHRIHVVGEVDLATAPQLKITLLNAIEALAPPHEVRIDLAEVTFMDAAGVAVLIDGRDAAQCCGVGFTVENARGIVRRVFDLLGLSQMFQLRG
jgi:anti-anti-sigma factor